MSNPYDAVVASTPELDKPANNQAPNPYDETTADLPDPPSPNTALRTSAIQSTQHPPDWFAQVKKDAAAAGIPAPVAFRNPDHAKKLAAANQYETYLNSSPKLAAMLADPAKAAVASDDTGTLADIEGGLKNAFHGSLSDWLTAFPKGLGVVGADFAKTVDLAGSTPALAYDKAASLVTGKPTFSAEDWVFRNMVQPVVNFEKGLTLSKGAGFVPHLIKDFSEALGTVGEALATGGESAGENPTVTTSVGDALRNTVTRAMRTMRVPALVGAVDQAQQTEARGGTPAEGVAAAIDSDLTNSLTAAIPLGMTGRIVKRAAGGFLAGLLMSEANRQAVNASLPADLQTPFDPEATLENALLMSIMGGLAGPHEVAAAHDAKVHESELRNLVTKAAQSKTRVRDPQTFQQFLQSATDDSEVPNVYVEPKELRAAAKKAGKTVADISPTAAAGIDAAEETGNNVRIPTAELLTNLPESGAEEHLIPHLKTSADGMSSAEADTFMQGHSEAFRQQTEDVRQAHEHDLAFQQSADAVEAKVADSLDKAGRFSPRVNATYATLTGAFYSNLAHRLGILPEEAAAKYPLRVGFDTQTDENRLDQSVFHGTSAPPFERFSLDHVGTGEGAQMYGWGLYFAENPEVAKAYQARDYKAEEKMMKQYNAAIARNDYESAEVWERLLLHETPADTLEHFNDPGNGYDSAFKAKAAKVTAMAEKMRSPDAGGIYTVHIPDEATAKMIHWDEKLRNQPANVKKVVRDELIKQHYLQPNDKTERSLEIGWRAYLLSARGLDTGQSIYEMVSAAHGTDKLASQYLDSVGVPGLKYADGGSRGTKGGTNNYVVFHDRHVEITHRDGTPVAKPAQETFKQSAIPPGPTDTPAFKKWFGDSKVVDAKGDPLVVYHGAPDVRAILTEGFKSPLRDDMVFTSDSRRVAATYADDHRALDYQNSEPATVPLYVSIQNPLVIDAHGEVWTETAERIHEAKAAGHDGIIIKNSRDDYNNDTSNKPATVYVAFKPTQVKSAITDPLRSRYGGQAIPNALPNRGTFDPNDPNILHQETPAKTGLIARAKALLQPDDAGELPRGQIAFNKDANTFATISLLRNADLSTFLHESGHFFLEVQTDVAHQLAEKEAAGETLTPGEKKVVSDTEALVKHLGGESVSQWRSLPIGARTEGHETFARSFEAYLFEGKSPSTALTDVFRQFASWLTHIYQSIATLKGHLTPEVRGIMDRMLASESDIQSAEDLRGLSGLFKTEADAKKYGVNWGVYQALGQEATDDAIANLQERTVRDMKWLSNAKNRALRQLQSKAQALRDEVNIDARREILTQPVYMAWRFLTAKVDEENKMPSAPKQDRNTVDPTRDSLLTAIGKLGGLNRKAVEEEWGVDPKDRPRSGVFGKHVLRAGNAGRTPESMAERLAELGYLGLNVHGQYELRDLEDKFHDETRGRKHYSVEYDPFEDEPAIGERTAGRLDRVLLSGLVGHEAEQRLTDLKMVAAHGWDPELVADLFGFETGTEMVNAILEAEPPHLAIEGLTDQMMLERHGDLSSPQALEAAANEAVANEARMRFVATELTALTKATGSKRVIDAAAKSVARKMVDGVRVRDLNPRAFERAGAKAAREAEVALKNGDIAEAARQKRTELVNLHAAREAHKAQDYLRKKLAYLKKFNTKTTRAALHVEFRDQIDALLSRFDLRTSLTPEAAKEKTQVSLEKFVENLAEMGFAPTVPERFVTDLQRVHYKDMPMGDFRGLVDSVESLDTVARKIQRIHDGAESVMLETAAADAAEALSKLPQRKAETNRGLTPLSKKWLGGKQAARSFGVSLLKMETLVDWLDNHDPNGVFNRLVFRKIADAEGARHDLQLDITAKWEAAINKLPKELFAKNRAPIVAQGLIDSATGEAQRFTWAEKMSLAGIRGDAGHFAKLLKGEGWDAPTVLKFLDDNMTAEEWNFVRDISGTFQNLLPLKNAMMRELGASNVPPVDHIPFQTAHGEMPGWYWPISYDPSRSQSVKERNARHDAALLEGNVFTRANTSTGRENTRVEGYAKPMLLSLNALPRVLAEEVRDITMRQAIVEADRFVRHPVVRKAVIAALSPEHYSAFNAWLLSVANDAAVQPTDLAFWDRLARGTRMTVTMTGLGFRITSVLVHGLSAGIESVAEIGPKAFARGVFDKRSLGAITELGPEWFKRGLSSFARSDQWEGNRRFILERSAEMRHRANQIDRDIHDKLRSVDLELSNPATSALRRGVLAIQSRAFSAYTMIDTLSALPTWMGAYQKALTPEVKGGLGMNEADAIYFADKTVRNAHGAGNIKDLAPVQRGGELFKLFTMFYTFWNHNLNRIADTARRARKLRGTVREAKASGDWSKVRGDIGTVLLRSFIYSLGIQYMHSMLYPEKEKKGGTWLGWFGDQMAGAAFGGVPIARDIEAVLTGARDDFALSPIVSVVSNTQMLQHDLTHWQTETAFIKHSLTEAGYFTGLPLGQVAETVQFLSDVWDGKQDPQTAADWWHGIISGHMKPQK